MHKRVIGITKEVSRMSLGEDGISFSFKKNILTLYENGKLVYLQKAKIGDLLELSTIKNELIDVNKVILPTDYYALINWLLRLNKNVIFNNIKYYNNFVNESIMSYSFYDNSDDELEKADMDAILYTNKGVTYHDTELIEVGSRYSNIRLLIRKIRNRDEGIVIMAAYINSPSRNELYDFMKRISPISYLPYGIYRYILSKENKYSNEPGIIY